MFWYYPPNTRNQSTTLEIYRPLPWDQSYVTTELVQGFVIGTYNSTGFFLRAKDENDNYIAFYSSEWSNASQRLKLIINYTTCGTFSPYDVDHNG